MGPFLLLTNATVFGDEDDGAGGGRWVGLAIGFPVGGLRAQRVALHTANCQFLLSLNSELTHSSHTAHSL